MKQSKAAEITRNVQRQFQHVPFVLDVCEILFTNWRTSMMCFDRTGSFAPPRLACSSYDCNIFHLLQTCSKVIVTNRCACSFSSTVLVRLLLRAWARGCLLLLLLFLLLWHGLVPAILDGHLAVLGSWHRMDTRTDPGIPGGASKVTHLEKRRAS